MPAVELVGILNVTSDSFSDGGLFLNPEDALVQAEALFHDGASMVDIGGESTRPGATLVSIQKEIQRLDPVITPLIKKYPHRISIDSYHPETIEHFAKISPTFTLNDVTGFNNPRMIKVAKKFNLRCILSHLPMEYGQDIQAAHASKHPMNTPQQVVDELLEREAEMINTGIDRSNIILDPGIGFGKTKSLNRQLLEFAGLVPDHEVMIGYSRKRFLGEDRYDIDTNLAAGIIAIRSGAKYLRVHDVAGHNILLLAS